MRSVVLKWGDFTVLQKVEKVLFVVQKMTENAAVFPAPDPPLNILDGKAGEVADAEAAASEGGKDRTQKRDQVLKEMIDMMNLQVLYVQTVTHGDPDMTALAGMETKSDGSKWPVPLQPQNFRAKPGKFDGSVYLKCNGTRYKKQYVFQMFMEDGEGSGTWEPIATQGRNVYLHGGLERGRIYRFRVYAINSAGAGTVSSEATSAAS